MQVFFEIGHLLLDRVFFDAIKGSFYIGSFEGESFLKCVGVDIFYWTRILSLLIWYDFYSLGFGHFSTGQHLVGMVL